MSEEQTWRILNAINEIKAYQRNCLVKNFRLVRVIIPKEVFEQWEKRSQDATAEFVISNPAILEGIQFEVDDAIQSIQYVIEGELELL